MESIQSMLPWTQTRESSTHCFWTSVNGKSQLLESMRSQSKHKNLGLRRNTLSRINLGNSAERDLIKMWSWNAVPTFPWGFESTSTSERSVWRSRKAICTWSLTESQILLTLAVLFGLLSFWGLMESSRLRKRHVRLRRQSVKYQQGLSSWAVFTQWSSWSTSCKRRDRVMRSGESLGRICRYKKMRQRSAGSMWRLQSSRMKEWTLKRLMAMMMPSFIPSTKK